MLIGIFIGAPLPEFARLIVDDAYFGLKKLLRRFDRHGSVDYDVYVSHDGVDAQIDSDLPPEAFLKLQEILPSVPSSRIIYDRDAHRWRDSGQSK